MQGIVVSQTSMFECLCAVEDNLLVSHFSLW